MIVDVLVDTGAQVSLVRKGLFPEFCMRMSDMCCQNVSSGPLCHRKRFPAAFPSWPNCKKLAETHMVAGGLPRGRILVGVMSCPIFSHRGSLIGVNTHYKPSNSLLKHVFFCFPTQKTGGVPLSLPKCTRYPCTLAGTLVEICRISFH